MADIDRLIAALRCSADTNISLEDCFFCEYAKKVDIEELELTKEEKMLFTEMEEGGKRYYVSCDCDRMAIDAAYMLDNLKTGVENLIEIMEE